MLRWIQERAMGQSNSKITNLLRKRYLIFLILLPAFAIGAINTFDRIVGTKANIDNVQIDGNTVSTTNTNGDLTLDMNGTGSVIFNDLTATTVPYLDASKKLTSSSITPTELGYLSGITSGLCGINQTCTFTNKTMSGASNTFSNIGYSSLVLTNSVVNADISASAAIALSKLAATTASRALVSDGSGVISPSSITSTELGYLGSVTSSLCGINQTCTLTNKSLSDSTTYFVDNTDNTKQLQFEISGITTGTTRTMTLLDANFTVVGEATTQNLSNKTFTSSTTTQNLVPSANATYDLGAAGNLYNKGFISALWRTDGYVSVDVQNHFLKNGNTFIAGWDTNYFTAYKDGLRIRSVDEAGYVGFSAPSTATTHYYTLPSTQGANYTTWTNNGSGVLSWSLLTNNNIDSSAAIARSKLASGSNYRVVVNGSAGAMEDAAAITASRALVSDANGIPTHSTVTSTELGYVSGVTSGIQAQINSLSSGSTPTGSRIGYVGTTAPTGWVLCSGRTIGNGSSGGTERANADTSTLFELLWNSYGNTELPIQDSAGAASTRGASAAADFAANKRMPLPDYRGRVGVGKDDMGGSTASRMTSGGAGIVGTTMGASGGAQTHTLATSELPAHASTQNSHAHSVAISSLANEGGTSNGYRASNAPGDTTVAAAVSATATNQNVGGGGSHNNTQPSIIETCIIKL
jgi:microcystin-dependent protein